MDDELQHLEAELKRLRPAAPSPDLAARIEHALSAPAEAPVRRPHPLASVHWIWFAAVPAAAAVAIAFTLAGRRAPPAPTAPVVAARIIPPPTSSAAPTAEAFKPVAAENVLYSATDEGLVVLADGTTARRERLKYVDTITWRNPRTNASLKWSVPREEVRVVPVVFQ